LAKIIQDQFGIGARRSSPLWARESRQGWSSRHGSGIIGVADSQELSLVPAITLRNYLTSDRAAACALHDRAAVVEMQGACDLRAFIPLAEDAVDGEDFDQATKTVACRNKQLLGFVGVDGNEVTWLYVDPDEFGQGVGRQLLKAGLANIQGLARVHVLAANHRALGLYGSEGFSIVRRIETRKNGYPCTVVEMTRC
jgi:ribosomal protein S18 acetylase RimI-like enzyme